MSAPASHCGHLTASLPGLLSANSGREQSQQGNPLIDHLVGACGAAGRHFEPEYFGSLEVDNKLELGGLIDRQIGGLLALENPGDIEPSAAIAIRDIIAVAHQPTLFDKFSDAIHGRNRVTRRQRDYLLASTRKERT